MSKTELLAETLAMITRELERRGIDPEGVVLHYEEKEEQWEVYKDDDAFYSPILTIRVKGGSGDGSAEEV